MSVNPMLVVAGFSGTPSERGAGIKQALVRDEASGLSFNAAHPDSLYTEEEVAAFAGQGLLVRRRMREPYAPGHVVLYATEAFIGSTEANGFRLAPDPLSLHAVGGAWLYLAVLPLDAALARLDQWSAMLLEDADRHVGRPDLDDAALALDSLERARFCTLSSRSPERRQRLFELMAAAVFRLGGPSAAVFDDAGIDFDASVVDAIRTRVARRIAALPVGPRRAAGTLVLADTNPADRERLAPRIRKESW